MGQQPAFIAMDPHFRLEVWLTPFRYAAILATTSALEGEYPELSPSRILIAGAVDLLLPLKNL